MSRSVKVLRCKTILLLTATAVFALNCRSDDGPSDEELKRVVRSCMTKMMSENNSNDGWERNVNFNRGYDQSNEDNGDRYNEHFQLKQSTRLRRSTPAPANHRRYDQRQSNNNNNNNSSNISEMEERDNGCIIHCFFEQINTINNDGYPDRHKLTYALTKDIHNRELRNFYSETIRECFHYLESKRRKDRCTFAKELVQCMTEYARANCDDWQDHTIIFS